MLNLVEGGFGSAAKKIIAERIRKNLGVRRSFLIVPEQQTVVYETRTYSALPKDAPLSFEVTNFTRFANTALRELGGIGADFCDKTTRALVMWRTLNELKSRLSFLGSSGELTLGTVTRTLEGVRELESLGIGSEELLKAKDGVRDGRLRSKLSDLTLILPLYNKLLAERYAEGADELTALCKRLDKSPTYLSGSDIYIDDFTSFTEAQYALIARLARRAEVTLHLPLPRAEASLFEYTEVRRAKERLLRALKRAGAECKIERISEWDGEHSPSLLALAPLLWRAEGKIDNSYLQNGELEVYRAKTPFEECAFVAADIRKRVREGARYSDFAIVARCADAYSGIIDTALAAADIPHFISKTTDATHFEAVKLISTAMQTVIRGFGAEDVISYSKLALSGVSADDADELELYVERWGITGGRFTDADAWNMNPRGYVASTDADAEKLLRINATRERLISPLLAFEQDTDGEMTVRSAAEALFKLISSIGLEEGLKQRARSLAALGEGAAADENSRLYKLILASLDKLVDTLGECPVSRNGFLLLLTVMFSSLVIGKIPTHKDEVLIGSADMLRPSERGCVYLIGVNYGEFPGTPSGSSYFTERESSELSALGLAIEPALDISGARELFSFTRALTSARERAVILYTEKTAAFSEAQPARVIKRIEEITQGRVKATDIGSLPPLRLAESPRLALSALCELSDRLGEGLLRALSDFGFGESVRCAGESVTNDALTLDPESAAILYGGDIYLSQSRIDAFLRCPMSYFLRYNLKLGDNERAELGANVIGSFVHSILENFFLELSSRGEKIHELTDEQRWALTESCAKKYVAASLGGATGARAELTISRLTRAARPVLDGLCDEFANCKFTPVFFELKTDKRSETLPDPVVFSTRDGGKVIINGTVDRVDSYTEGDKTYVRVIDYKTGSKVFSPDDMARGENLQMFLYLKAITETDKPRFKEALGASEEGRLIPAGVIYVKAKVGDVKVDLPSEELALDKIKEKQERSGMLLDDAASISAMNPDFLPITLKDGAPDKKSAKYIYDAAAWDKIGNDIQDVILEVCENMKGGSISAKNTTRTGDSACVFCSYRSVCRSYKPPRRYK